MQANFVRMRGLTPFAFPIHIRYDKAPSGTPARMLRRIPVYYKGTRIGEAKALDRIANDRPPAPLKSTRS